MTAMLSLPALLDHLQVTSHKGSSWLDQARTANWQIEASGLQHFDSSALALLLDLRRCAETENAVLKVYHTPKRLTQLAELYGVNPLIA